MRECKNLPMFVPPPAYPSTGSTDSRGHREKAIQCGAFAGTVPEMHQRIALRNRRQVCDALTVLSRKLSYVCEQQRSYTPFHSRWRRQNIFLEDLA